MPVWPKSFFTVGARILTARTARRLGRKKNDVPAQNRVLHGLVARLATTSFWKGAGLEAGMGYAQFKSRVPVRKYEDFAPAIERMKAGEPNVLWPGQCGCFSVTPRGAASKAPEPARFFPVTAEMREHFREAAMESLFYYTARTGNTRVFQGRHLFLNGANPVTPTTAGKPFETFAGNLRVAAASLPEAIQKHFYEPGACLPQTSDWESNLDAIIKRTKPLNITLLAGIPSWLVRFADALRSQFGTSGESSFHLQKIWPNLDCVVHGGAPLAPFAEELRRILGPTVNFHEVYSASEAFIAAQDGEARSGLRLMAAAGIFYEFVPLEDFDEGRLANVGNKAVPFEDVRTGVDYAVLITTPGGLCRYIIGDVVRFVSTEPPRLQWIGRAGHQMTTFGERVTEKDLSDALITICQRNTWTIVNFHVAPLVHDP
ncbi:MAG: GH3 auxin-responsive promoter family protein, partial [Opitutaceae bacterium]